MLNNQEKSNKNNTALIVGLFLIIIVVVITFSRSSRENKKNDFQPAEDSSALTEVQKTQRDKKISSGDLLEKTNRREAEVMDIRSPDSFQKEHIIDSENISVDEILKNPATLDKNKIYVFVDDNETVSADLAVELTRNNFDKVFYLGGGFLSWKSQFYPTISDGDPESFTDQAKVKYIKSDDLKKLMETENDLLVIDVRKNGNFSEGRLKNSVNIFLDDLEKKRREIPAGKKIILYDNDGLWAYKAAVRLFDLGIVNVLTLSDGLDSWRQKGFEVVK